MQIGGALVPNYTTRGVFNAKLFHQVALQFKILQLLSHLLSMYVCVRYRTTSRHSRSKTEQIEVKLIKSSYYITPKSIYYLKIALRKSVYALRTHNVGNYF